MKDYLSIYQGIVVDNNDPLKIGRCKIKVPSIHGNISQADYTLLPWAYYVTPNSTGSKRSTFILPKNGDTVWVQFINGDKGSPVFFGSSYAKSEPPVSDDEYFNTDVVYSSGDGAKLKKNDKEFRMEYNDSYISISSSGNIDIKATGIITINGTKINLN